ncbi:MAG TPA: endolytic transglycosylase MltG [Acidobacteriota bacterium]|jgi:UPF0755 protein
MRVLVWFLVVLVLLLGAAGYGWITIHTPFKGYSGAEKIVGIDRGDSARRISYRMAENGVVRSAPLFYIYLRSAGKAGRMKAGDYQFTHPVTMAQVADKLYRGDVYLLRVTVPEGLIHEEIKPLFLHEGLGREEDFDQAFRDVRLIQDWDEKAQNLEGYLFPDTYLFPRQTTAAQVLEQMVKNFRKRMDSSRMERARQLNMSVRQVVTLASLIEKETALESERFLVSSVYHNRMKQGMVLACDPTVIYAARLLNRWDGVINQSDLAIESPYNTYKYAGLPPGPIANPGVKSLDAALHPADTRYLYFVARDDHSHIFNEDFASHQKAVADYRKMKPGLRDGGIEGRRN